MRHVQHILADPLGLAVVALLLLLVGGKVGSWHTRKAELHRTLQLLRAARITARATATKPAENPRKPWNTPAAFAAKPNTPPARPAAPKHAKQDDDTFITGDLPAYVGSQRELWPNRTTRAWAEQSTGTPRKGTPAWAR